jgi:hypothetical protein
VIGCGWEGVGSVYVLSKSSRGCVGVVLKIAIVLFLGLKKLFGFWIFGKTVWIFEKTV